MKKQVLARVATLTFLLLSQAVRLCSEPSPTSEFVDLHDLLGSVVDVAGGAVDFRMVAPLVVVATITSNEPEGDPVEARRFPGVFVQLRRVTCRLETSLRGPKPADQFKFYYFADAKLPRAIPNPVHRQLFEASPGRRYLLFLCKERNVLRSIGDVGAYSIAVLSGAHSSYEAAQEDPFSTGLSRAISDILLTPGEGFDPNEFAHSLLYSRSISDQVGSRRYTVRLLSLLLDEPEPLRSAACFELAHSYYGQYSCLSQLKDDAKLDLAVREHARESLSEQIRLNTKLKEELRDPARLSFSKLTRPDSRIANYEELQLILIDPDPEVRALACIALKRYYPQAPVEACK